MIPRSYLERLPPCEPGCDESGPCEMKEAILWTYDQTTAYPSGSFTPALTPLMTEDKAKPFICFTTRLGRLSRLGGGIRVTYLEWYQNGNTNQTERGSSLEDIARTFERSLLTKETRGHLLITSGKDRNVLDHLLGSVGQYLVSRGYTVQPFVSGGQVSIIDIRKDKHKWSICQAETMTGVSVSTLLGYARDVGALPETKSGGIRQGKAEVLSYAIDAYSQWLMLTFGVALRPTVGMIALRSARRHLPEDFKKWRPDPYLVAIERHGRGYRGGLTYAVQYKGPTWRIDINRAYTNALQQELPMRAAFGAYIDQESTPHGVFLCRVRVSNGMAVTLGVYHGPDHGFTVDNVGSGTYLSWLHSSEIPGLEAAGCHVYPYYGFIFTRTFNLAGYVERIQSVLSDSDSADEAKLTKPLGNYVYGKLGQNPRMVELMFADKHPGEGWHPFVDGELKAWDQVFERETVRHTSTQHVEIAATITGYARTQILLMRAYLEECGLQVVRMHTDSLTLTSDPSRIIQLDYETIGQWKPEYDNVDSIIVGPNAFIDHNGAHIAGVKAPTWEQVERIYDGHIVYVTQTQNAPRTGWARGVSVVQKAYRARFG